MPSRPVPRVDIGPRPQCGFRDGHVTQGAQRESTSGLLLEFIRKEDLLSSSTAKLVGNESASAIFIIPKEKLS